MHHIKLYSGVLLICLASLLSIKINFDRGNAAPQGQTYLLMSSSELVPSQDFSKNIKASLFTLATNFDKPVINLNKPSIVANYSEDSLESKLQVKRPARAGRLHRVPGGYVTKISIDSNLYSDARKSRVPQKVINSIISAYRHLVNFQSELKPGNTMTVMYSNTERLMYAELSLRKRNLKIYNYGNGDFDRFCDESGLFIQSALLQTPISGARISSLFGRRRHPILGYSKKHRGVDFAAPQGTPIVAAGNGQITQMGVLGGYGKCMTIRHLDGIKTRYAHMSKFNSHLKVGAKVKQGQVIGKVGKTGMATGPHLHFEVIHNGIAVSPMKVKLVNKRKEFAPMHKFSVLKNAIDSQVSDFKYFKSVNVSNELL